MAINLVYNKYIEDYKTSLEIAESILIKQKVDFCSFDIESMQNYGDFTLTIGGDGTLLRTAKFYSKFKVPVLGINQGRLGFLSQADMSEIEFAINNILEQKYTIEERIMLFDNNHFALNDFVIKGCDSTRTSKFYLEINKKCVCDYIADGLIISTPTGSTAYGLSAGGPVIHPSLDVITIVPICPHTLNARPLVVPAQEKIVVKTSDKLLSVSADGYDKTEGLDKIEISMANDKAYLAFINKEQFYSVLRNKLHWGVAPER